MKPIINIERLPQDANPCVYTYAIIPAFQRFYFVEDWVWNDGLWEVHMSEDVLGTWKTQIGASTEYVLRTDSITDYNGEITDTTYPATTDFTIRSQISSGPFPTTISVGCYVVGIISGNSASAVGAEKPNLPVLCIVTFSVKAKSFALNNVNAILFLY